MRRKVDQHLTRNQSREVDYRNADLLNRYLTNWGKIKSGKDTNLSAKYQRALARAIKRARFLGLLPYVKR